MQEATKFWIKSAKHWVEESKQCIDFNKTEIKFLEKSIDRSLNRIQLLNEQNTNMQSAIAYQEKMILKAEKEDK